MLLQANRHVSVKLNKSEIIDTRPLLSLYFLRSLILTLISAQELKPILKRIVASK